jgi:Leucine-rich repeat (LRR) protein
VTRPAPQILELSRNQIASLEALPASLPELSELYLAGNRLRSLARLSASAPALDIAVGG